MTKRNDDGMRTVNVNGIEVAVDAKRMQEDWELFELVCDIQADPEGNSFRIVSLLRELLGDEGYKKVKDALRNDEGIVTNDAMNGFITDMFASLSPNS